VVDQVLSGKDCLLGTFRPVAGCIWGQIGEKRIEVQHLKRVESNGGFFIYIVLIVNRLLERGKLAVGFETIFCGMCLNFA